MSEKSSPSFVAAKVLTAIVWVVAIGAHFVPGDALWLEGLRVTAYVLFAAHALEAVLVLPVLRRAGGSLAEHVAQMLFFGMIHYGELRTRTRQTRSEG